MTRYPVFTAFAVSALMGAGALAFASSRAVSASPSDQQITQDVKDKLQADDPAIASAIVVTTHDGVVTLKGVALTSDYLTRALFDARGVDGVVKVRNEMSLN